MEFRFTLRDNGMRAAFQLLHMVLEVSPLSTVLVVSVSNVFEVLGFIFWSQAEELELYLIPLNSSSFSQ
jgi:hypothetical protein